MKYRKYVVAFLAALIIIVVAIFFRGVAIGFVRASWRKALAWHINPWIFVTLLFATLYHYYKSWFQIARGLVRRDRAEIARGVALNRFVWSIPYLYVLIFGRGYPWWVPVGVIGWMAFGIISFARNMRKPEYVNRMTHSWVGRIVGKFVKSNRQGE